MKTMGLLIFSISSVVLFLILPSQGAPRKPYNTYDQRQDGKFNVHAKLDNFLIVVAPSSSAGNAELASLLQNDLVAQALDLKNIASRVASHQEDSDDPIVEEIKQAAGQQSDKKKTRHEDPREPAGETLITRITTEKLSKEDNGKDKGAVGVKVVAIVQREFPVDAVASELSESIAKEDKDLKNIGAQDSQAGGQAAESDALEKTARSLSNRSGDSSVSKLPPVDSEAVSLENKVSGIGIIDRRNDVGPADREPQELKLLGGAIENCGPERFRDRFGVCRSRTDV